MSDEARRPFKKRCRRNAPPPQRDQLTDDAWRAVLHRAIDEDDEAHAVIRRARLACRRLHALCASLVMSPDPRRCAAQLVALSDACQASRLTRGTDPAARQRRWTRGIAVALRTPELRDALMVRLEPGGAVVAVPRAARLDGWAAYARRCDATHDLPFAHWLALRGTMLGAPSGPSVPAAALRDADAVVALLSCRRTHALLCEAAASGGWCELDERTLRALVRTADRLDVRLASSSRDDDDWWAATAVVARLRTLVAMAVAADEARFALGGRRRRFRLHWSRSVAAAVADERTRSMLRLRNAAQIHVERTCRRAFHAALAGTAAWSRDARQRLQRFAANRATLMTARDEPRRAVLWRCLSALTTNSADRCTERAQWLALSEAAPRAAVAWFDALWRSRLAGVLGGCRCDATFGAPDDHCLLRVGDAPTRLVVTTPRWLQAVRGADWYNRASVSVVKRGGSDDDDDDLGEDDLGVVLHDLDAMRKMAAATTDDGDARLERKLARWAPVAACDVSFTHHDAIADAEPQRVRVLARLAAAANKTDDD